MSLHFFFLLSCFHVDALVQWKALIWMPLMDRLTQAKKKPRVWETMAAATGSVCWQRWDSPASSSSVQRFLRAEWTLASKRRWASFTKSFRIWTHRTVLLKPQGHQSATRSHCHTSLCRLNHRKNRAASGSLMKARGGRISLQCRTSVWKVVSRNSHPGHTGITMNHTSEGGGGQTCPHPLREMQPIPIGGVIISRWAAWDHHPPGSTGLASTVQRLRLPSRITKIHFLLLRAWTTTGAAQSGPATTKRSLVFQRFHTSRHQIFPVTAPWGPMWTLGATSIGINRATTMMKDRQVVLPAAGPHMKMREGTSGLRNPTRGIYAFHQLMTTLHRCSSWWGGYQVLESQPWPGTSLMTCSGLNEDVVRVANSLFFLLIVLLYLLFRQAAAVHRPQRPHTEHWWLLFVQWRLPIWPKPSWSSTWMEPEQRYLSGIATNLIYNFYFIVNIETILQFLTAEDAMRDGRSPIIIDNTNIQAWEMKPYVGMVSDAFHRSVCIVCTTLPP